MVLAVDSVDPADVISDYIRKEGFGFTPLMDAKKQTAKRYHVKACPTTYVIGRDGRIVAGGEGMAPEKIGEAVEKALGQGK